MLQGAAFEQLLDLVQVALHRAVELPVGKLETDTAEQRRVCPHRKLHVLFALGLELFAQPGCLRLGQRHSAHRADVDDVMVAVIAAAEGLKAVGQSRDGSVVAQKLHEVLRVRVNAAAPRLVDELRTLLLFDGWLHQKLRIIGILPKQIADCMKLAQDLFLQRFLAGKIIQRAAVVIQQIGLDGRRAARRGRMRTDVHRRDVPCLIDIDPRRVNALWGNRLAFRPEQIRRREIQLAPELLAALNHHETALRVTAERAMNTRLEGGCQVPIGSYAELIDGEIWLRALVGAPDGSQIIRGERRGAPQDAEQMGISLAEELLNNGAREILAEVYNGDAPA